MGSTWTFPKPPATLFATIAAELGYNWATMSSKERKELKKKTAEREKKQQGSFDPLPHIQVGKKKKKKNSNKVSKKYSNGKRSVNYEG